MKQQYHINFEGIRKAWRDSNISRSAKVILFDLLLYAGVSGESFPSEELLAQNQNLSSRQVRNLLRELNVVGLIKWIRGGFGQSNSYTFNREIYYLTDNSSKQPTSAHSGNQVPQESGNAVPTNVVRQSSHLNSRHIEQSSQNLKSSFPCGQNGCKGGFIFSNNKATHCKCNRDFKEELIKEGSSS